MSAIYKNGRYYGVGGGEGADTEIIADDFDPTESYSVGDYVVYEGDLYKCTTAHTGEWNASNFDATQVMEEIPTPMPAADMSDIVTPLPSVMSRRFKYSTEEQVIGEWIDGKPLYQKTFSGSATGSSSTWVEIGSIETVIPNIETLTALNGYGFEPSASLKKVFALNIDVNGYGTLEFKQTFTGSSMTYTYYVTIQYTKTTD